MRSGLEPRRLRAFAPLPFYSDARSATALPRLFLFIPFPSHNKAEAKAKRAEENPLQKVDKFTKQMHHKRERQMAKLRINEELRRIVN